MTSVMQLCAYNSIKGAIPAGKQDNKKQSCQPVAGEMRSAMFPMSVNGIRLGRLGLCSP